MAKKKKSPVKKKGHVGLATPEEAGGLTVEAAELLEEALTFKEHPTHKLAMSELTMYPQGGHLGVTLSNHPLGVLVVNLDEADLAFTNGLRPGDIIIAVNHQKVESHQAAAKLMFDKDPNLELEITYHKAAVADREIIRRRKPTEFVAIELVVGGRRGHVGLTLANHPLGVLVQDASTQDLAYQAGIRPNDVIVTLNGYAVVHHAEAVRLIDEVGSTTGSVRLTYYPAEAAANELVLVSSYGPRGSDLSESGLVSTSMSSGTGTQRDGGGSVNKNYSAFWTEREQRQKAAWMFTERERRQERAGGGPKAPIGEDDIDIKMELNYSITSSSGP